MIDESSLFDALKDKLFTSLKPKHIDGCYYDLLDELAIQVEKLPG